MILTLNSTPALQKAGHTLRATKTMNANTLTAALNLNEKFDDSLQNSTMDEAEVDTEVAVINGLFTQQDTLTIILKKGRKKHNKNDTIVTQF